MSSEPQDRLFQLNQPEGVPPLELTGERTLPDLPEENYWFQRHLVVYEWLAKRVSGRSVIDMACGEGYGSALMATTASAAVGVDANPEAFEHARLRYQQPNLKFARELVEEFSEPADFVVFLQTIEHVQDPGAILRHFKTLVRDSEIGEIVVSTPNLLTLAGPDAEKSENPWHVKEYRAAEFRQLLESEFEDVQIYGVWHARMLKLHEFAINRLAWDSVHKSLRLTKPFYDRFTPAISTKDFELRLGRDDADLDGALDFVAVCK